MVTSKTPPIFEHFPLSKELKVEADKFRSLAIKASQILISSTSTSDGDSIGAQLGLFYILKALRGSDRGIFMVDQSPVPLVIIEDYCLMPNHYHLILEQVEENGISKFLQKVMTGYTMYFNKRYNRTGALFQGKTKSRHIDTNPYYLQLKIYLHLNPVDLFDKNWKENGKVKSVKESMKFLTNFPWSSCTSYKTYEKYLSGQSKLLYLDDLY
jgi:hypothetical protein